MQTLKSNEFWNNNNDNKMQITKPVTKINFFGRKKNWAVSHLVRQPQNCKQTFFLKMALHLTCINILYDKHAIKLDKRGSNMPDILNSLICSSYSNCISCTKLLDFLGQRWEIMISKDGGFKLTYWILKEIWQWQILEILNLPWV